MLWPIQAASEWRASPAEAEKPHIEVPFHTFGIANVFGDGAAAACSPPSWVPPPVGCRVVCCGVRCLVLLLAVCQLVVVAEVGRWSCLLAVIPPWLRSCENLALSAWYCSGVTPGGVSRWWVRVPPLWWRWRAAWCFACWMALSHSVSESSSCMSTHHATSFQVLSSGLAMPLMSKTCCTAALKRLPRMRCSPPPSCFLWSPPLPAVFWVFCRWGWCRVCHVRLCVQAAEAAAVVAVVCLWVSPLTACWCSAAGAGAVCVTCGCVSRLLGLLLWWLLCVCAAFWVFGCVAAAAVGSWVGAAPPSSVLAAGAVGHCGSTDASVAGSLACGVEEHAVLVSLWRRQRGLHSVAAAVPALELVGGCCGGCGGGWCGGGCGTSSQRVASAVAAAVVGGACWSASSVSLSLRAGEVTLVHASVCASVAGSLSVPSCVGGWCLLPRRRLCLQCWGLAGSGRLPCMRVCVGWLRWLQRRRLQV